jgi:hypothetical protein
MVPTRVSSLPARKTLSIRIGWAIALLGAAAPLWASQTIPLVDLPQHLHLISVLHRLDDPSTLFPSFFAQRGELTPYLGYYYAVSFLNWLLPLELANRLFLTAYAVGLPLSVAFLLRTLRRPSWPALLAIPFAYGDSLAWGFINYCAALPLALLTCALFVRAIVDVPRRRSWAIGAAAALVAVLLFHVQVFAWLAFALPALLFMTSTPKPWLHARRAALLSVVPGVLLFVLWVGLRLGQPQEIAPGQPWKAWGPLLSKENLQFNGFAQNLADLMIWPKARAEGSLPHFPVLAGMTVDGSDDLAVSLTLLIALGAVVVRLLTPISAAVSTSRGLESWRMFALLVAALALYFLLPFDIHGYMYYLNRRYAHLVAILAVASVPSLSVKWSRLAFWLAAASVLFFVGPLWRAFRAFDAESESLRRLAREAGSKPRVMGLVFAAGSKAVSHPVYLHAACELARAGGGLTNFSFALTPHSPLKYQSTPPPTFPSEWRPDQMSWEEHGRHYDHFVVRGVDPQRIFGPLLQDELYLAAQAGDFSLVRRRTQ